MSGSKISDAEILRRIKAEEDGFVERKSLGDWKKDAVKTCVAFANSCPVDGPPGLLCVGVKDDGTIETSSTQNLDTLQKTLEREFKEAYPDIPHNTRIVVSPEGKFIAIIVPGSTQGPHFAGPAYIRNGSQTVPASKEIFERIIDRRDRIVREILKWRNKQVKVARVWAKPTFQRIAGYADMTVIDCDSFVVTLRNTPSDPPLYFSLEHIVLGRDSTTNALMIEVPQD